MINQQPAIKLSYACSEGVENTQNKTVPEKVMKMNADLPENPKTASGHMTIAPATTGTELMPLDRDALKERCPLPVLMKRIGLSKYIKKSCRSPLRDDENASWGIFKIDDHWFWKDHGTGESGDEIDFLERYFGKDVKKDFVDLLKFYAVKAQQPQDDQDVVLNSKLSGIKKEKPDCSGFGFGSEAQIQIVSQKRQIKPEALTWAQSRGLLKFGFRWQCEVYGITDITGNAMATRRVNNEMFPAVGKLLGCKARHVPGTTTKWPIGILEARDCDRILLLEGVPDFLAAHQVIMDENAKDQVAPVCMLAAGIGIDSEVLPIVETVLGII